MRNNLPFCEKQYPVPMCQRDAVQRQLNRANFDRSFCPNFSLTATPLTALFKGKNKWRCTGSLEGFLFENLSTFVGQNFPLRFSYSEVRPPTPSDKLFRVSSWLKLPSNFVAKNMNNHQKTPNWATLSVSYHLVRNCSRVLSLKMTFCIFGGRKESSTVCVSLKRYHEAFGHFGSWKTWQALRAEVWWTNMNRDVKKVIKCCIVCQKAKITQNFHSSLHAIIPNKRKELLTLDLYGPLPHRSRGRLLRLGGQKSLMKMKLKLCILR